VSRTAATPVLPLVSAASVARFLSKVDQRDPVECWPWLGLMRPNGYGRFPVDGRIVSPHRFAWVLVNGRDPAPGMELDHTCRNRACVNPAHMQEVTYRENVLRSNNRAAQNARKTHCKHGHPFTPENTYVRPDGKGKHCRECNTRRQRELKARRGEVAA
jgi:hypothetical protein